MQCSLLPHLSITSLLSVHRKATLLMPGLVPHRGNACPQWWRPLIIGRFLPMRGGSGSGWTYWTMSTFAATLFRVALLVARIANGFALEVDDGDPSWLPYAVRPRLHTIGT